MVGMAEGWVVLVRGDSSEELFIAQGGQVGRYMNARSIDVWLANRKARQDWERRT